MREREITPLRLNAAFSPSFCAMLRVPTSAALCTSVGPFKTDEWGTDEEAAAVVRRKASYAYAGAVGSRVYSLPDDGGLRCAGPAGPGRRGAMRPVESGEPRAWVALRSGVGGSWGRWG